MPKLPRHLQLTGGDYFIHAIDRQMRRAGMAGNVCRIALRLEGELDAERLRAALAASPVVDWLARVRMIRLLPVLSPVWRTTRGGTGLVLREHLADEEGFGDGCGGASSADEKRWQATGTPKTSPEIVSLRSNRAPAVGLDLFRGKNGVGHLVLSWHHALMDVRGAELLLRHIAGSAGDGVGALYHPDQADFNPMRVVRGYVRKVIFARQSLHFISHTGREPLFSLLPASRPGVPCGGDIRAVWFDEAETARIDAHCERLNAGFRRSHFYLACCLRAFHAVAAARGNREAAYLVPVPHDLRRCGASGPIFSNQVSFLFFRVEPALAGSLEATIAELSRQMTGQIRNRTPGSFMAAMELFKPTPLDFYIHQLGSSSRGKFATFCFSDAGESCPGMDEFFGARVAAVTHYAPASRPPGLTLVFSRTRGRLCAVISRVSDCLADGELDLLERGLRAALLDEEARD